jgi:hypothetical protein
MLIRWRVLGPLAVLTLIAVYHLLKEPLAELKYLFLRRWYFTQVAARPTSKRFAILVPFMDNALQGRAAQLEQFLVHIHRQLRSVAASFQIIVLNQSKSDSRNPLPFNRGQLLNQGTLIALLQYRCDYVILHDVDLIPDSVLVQYYLMDPLVPLHLASPSAWGKYEYDTFIGGVVSVRTEALIAANGYPNFYFGWGREDDALFSRLWSSGSGRFWEPAQGRIRELKHPHFEDLMDAKYNFSVRTFTSLQRQGHFRRDGPLIAPRHSSRVRFEEAVVQCVNIGYPGAEDGLKELQQIAPYIQLRGREYAHQVSVFDVPLLLPPTPPCA